MIGIIGLLLAVVAIVYAILVKREASAGARKVFAVLGIIAAIALTFACGASYMMSSHAMWDTITRPLAYLGTAAASGTALYLALCAALGTCLRDADYWDWTTETLARALGSYGAYLDA